MDTVAMRNGEEMEIVWETMWIVGAKIYGKGCDIIQKNI